MSEAVSPELIVLNVVTRSMSLDEKVYADPYRFWPERYLPKPIGNEEAPPGPQVQSKNLLVLPPADTLSRREAGKMISPLPGELFSFDFYDRLPCR